MKSDVGEWGPQKIAPGQRKRLRLEFGKSFSGSRLALPLMVWRAREPGPVVGVTAAIHGDEINGTGAIRSLVGDPPFTLKRGSLILVPVINIPGFERHSRYLPDRRDLNRSFPGRSTGSLSARLARLVFDEIVGRCDFLIDLHTAAVRRTNFPNVRADCSDPECERLARAFGCEVIVDGEGPDGSLRREAVKAGSPTIVVEAGEIWKVESAILDFTLRGMANVFAELGMTEGAPEQPPHQFIVEETHWVRSESAGFLSFHVSPGSFVSKGQPLASNTTLLGTENETIRSPHDGIVMGMTTMPAVGAGDPVVHIAMTGTKRENRKMEKSINELAEDSMETDLREQLATNIAVTYMEEET